MNREEMEKKAKKYLNTLCAKMPDRCPGRKQNIKALLMFENIMALYGWKTKRQVFSCITWKENKPVLEAGNKKFSARVSPYSKKCGVKAALKVVSTLDRLRDAEIKGTILLLKGKIAAEQIMPKNFVFYNPPHHKEIYTLLEKKAPAAIITATGRNPQAAGGVYPFPMFEDGDFDIPSVYIKDTLGEKLALYENQPVKLSFNAQRKKSKAWNVAAFKGNSGRRITICAHIDTKDKTPGAVDNATGIVTLMLLAEMLKDYNGKTPVELLVLNGEDFYAVPGQMKYLELNKGKMGQIKLAVNMDGMGFKGKKTAFSFYGIAGKESKKISSVFLKNQGFIKGDMWPQGDHMVFASAGVPAAAITSENLNQLCADITHTYRDKPSIADCAKLVDTAEALKELILKY
ncbi:MAG TPA: M28 family peptidase [Candidatus Goldiibacteriota bacterium]|nr:M28 family peptidase [Candidatus Goldiibacteriota bacterium]HRQ44629.1 M28 family peptidase [Candidatus Goldiibacteriota bacterium]